MFSKTFSSLLALSGLAGVQSQIMVGPITITENGQDMTRYVVSTDPEYSSTDGSSLTMQHGANVQIAANDSDSYEPYMFVGYTLDGATLSFTADLSSISCSCNAALYFVSMPALDDSSNPTGGDSGNYYCDANDVNGELCWELDIMEANMYVSQSTPHSCDQSPGQPTYSCDGGGCATNSYNENGAGMCPDASCTINTQSPFEFAISFSASDYHVAMSQNGQTFEFDVCNDASYVSNFQQAIDYGLVLVMSYWGSDYSTMEWLDDMTGCTGDCDTSGAATFSNISVSSSSGAPVTVDWKSQVSKGVTQTLEETSSEVNSKADHEFVTHEGKHGTKEKLSVPREN